MTSQPHNVPRRDNINSCISRSADLFNVIDSPIARSASSVQLGNLPARSVTTLRRTWSEGVLVESRRSLDNVDQIPVVSGGEGDEARKSRSATTSKIAAPGSITNPLLGIEDGELELRPQKIDPKRRSVSRSLSRLTQKSWLLSSRSPSPSLSAADRDRGLTHANPGDDPSSTFSPLAGSTRNTQDHDRPSKTRRRPLSTLIAKGSFLPTIPPVSTIPGSNIIDEPYCTDKKRSERPLGIPQSISSDRLQHRGAAATRKRDELSGAFKALAADFQKQVCLRARLKDSNTSVTANWSHRFQVRTSILKIALVRSSLLPFLKNCGDHPINTALRPEDLDRRVNILNKWWIGLLGMLRGRNGEAISSGERPTILEAVTMLMIRPEWTAPYGLGVGIIHSLPASRSTTSLGSASSDVLLDSVLANIKNMYAQNLLAQMAYIVEKMSSRTVPASLVSFCGKATAYAFFFCDGIAEILVRIWTPSRETMQRILAQNGVQKNVDLAQWSDCMMSRFPSSLHGLIFRSLKVALRHLRSRPQPPVATTHIPWHGPWIGRWAGRDTDLFFNFTKSYYNLISNFLPSDFGPHETLCVPGYVFLQAQLLTVLDSTIQKDNNHPTFNVPNISSMANIEVLEEANVSASMLPILPIAIRSMAENRLILLLRDCLSGSANIVQRVRDTFAESFEFLLKAAARRTSLFDHGACFTLCDFLEEAITILSRYSNTSTPISYTIDWAFWLRVCRQMLESQNTMTEIRLHALLFSQWGIMTAEEGRKQLCVGWLLEERVFHRTFNHWCPMVRAYYMRLLCWRVGRPNDPKSESDIATLKALALRLNNNWLGFVHFQSDALSKREPRLSTAPCTPAPGRGLLIVRNDSQPTSGANETHSTPSTSISREESHKPSNTPSLGRRKWTMLKGMLPFAASSTDSSMRNVANPNTESGELQGKTSSQDSSNVSDGQGSTAFQVQSFKFSLEWIGHDYKSPFGRERQLYQPQLPLSVSNSLRPSYHDGASQDLQEPGSLLASQAKYAGRALAEWDLLITECQDFFKKRRSEGVPSDLLVETPTLGVETFRRPG
ncbi:MAG: hypothetical protein Q9218_000687 [Villophora microphyllina]